jgi:hypothetical protein
VRRRLTTQLAERWIQTTVGYHRESRGYVMRGDELFSVPLPYAEKNRQWRTDFPSSDCPSVVVR